MLFKSITLVFVLYMYMDIIQAAKAVSTDDDGKFFQRQQVATATAAKTN